MIEKIDPAEQEVSVRFDDRLVVYDYGGTGRGLVGVRGHHSQVAGLGVPCGGHPSRHAALHAAPAQLDLHRHYPRQAVAGGGRAAEGSGARSEERPGAEEVLRSAE